MESRQSDPVTKSALLRLVDEYAVKDQIADVEWSLNQLSEKLNKGKKATQHLMDKLCKDGRWDKRKARLTNSNGHTGIVYFEVVK